MTGVFDDINFAILSVMPEAVRDLKLYFVFLCKKAETLNSFSPDALTADGSTIRISLWIISCNGYVFVRFGLGVKVKPSFRGSQLLTVLHSAVTRVIK